MCDQVRSSEKTEGRGSRCGIRGLEAADGCWCQQVGGPQGGSPGKWDGEGPSPALTASVVPAMSASRSRTTRVAAMPRASVTGVTAPKAQPDMGMPKPD